MQKVFLGYVRKSIITDPNTASPARQRGAIERRLAAIHPGAIIEWYEDLDKSGRNEVNRPDWQRLLKRVHDPDVAGVIVESIDRNHRNLKQFLTFYDDILAPAGKTLISALQNIDMSTADGRALASVIMTFAEMEARKGSERMTGTLSRIREDGRFHGGNPFGCDRHPETKHLIPSARAYLYNPTTAEAQPDSDPDSGLPQPWERRYFHDALHALFQAYATGTYSLFDVALYLNAAGWRFWDRKRRDPIEFKESNTQSIISNWEIYAGRIPVAAGQRASGVQRPTSLQGAYPPILPVELCEKAGLILRARVGTGGPKPAGLFLAGGVVYCSTCGTKLVGHTVEAGKGWSYYRHRPPKNGCAERQARSDDIHQEITAIIGKLLDGRLLDKITALLRRISEMVPQSPDTAKILEKEAEMERLISLHLKRLITEAEFIKFRTTLQAELDKLKPATQTMVELEMIVDQLEGLLRGFEGDDPLQQKETVRNLFERIEISDRRISRVVLQPWCAGLLAVGPLDVWTKVKASISTVGTHLG